MGRNCVFQDKYVFSDFSSGRQGNVENKVSQVARKLALEDVRS